MHLRYACALAAGLVSAAMVAASSTQVAAVPADDQRSAKGDPRSATSGVLVSRQLLESRHLRIGDVIRLSADPAGSNPRRFRIDGVYEPTPDPARFAQAHLEARLHLPDLIDLAADPADPAQAGTIGSINVRLRRPDDAAAFARDVSARLPTIVARPTAAADDRNSPFVVLERFHLAIAVVTVVGSAIFLLALMVMLVDERRGTVGTLRLIGLTRGRLLLQVLAEGTAIAIAGAAFGILFALGAEGFFNRFFQWRYDTALVFLRITPRVAWQSLLLAVPLGIAASLVASWTILRQPLLGLIRR